MGIGGSDSRWTVSPAMRSRTIRPKYFRSESVSALDNLAGQKQSAHDERCESKPKRTGFSPCDGITNKEDNEKQELQLDDSDNRHGALRLNQRSGLHRPTASGCRQRLFNAFSLKQTIAPLRLRNASIFRRGSGRHCGLPLGQRHRVSV